MKKPIILLLVLLLAGTAGYRLSAQTTQASITGIITDENKKPIDGASIVLTNESTGFTTATLTNEKGQYQIETIVPGRYPVPPNLPGFEKYAGLTRPAHIHFRVIESLHIPLTAQLYFKGDPFIAKDPWAGHKQSLAIDLKQDGNLQRGVFDIALARGL